MAKSSIYDLQSVGDPAQVTYFDLFLPTIPGSSNTRDLTFKCQTTDVPGFALEPVTAALHGVQLKFAGRKTYTQTLNATFLETIDWGTREKFRRWSEIIRSWTGNSGSYSSLYKVTAEIALYDPTPAVVRTVQLVGFWPETVPEVTMDGGQSAIVMQNITFSYDYPIDL